MLFDLTLVEKLGLVVVCGPHILREVLLPVVKSGFIEQTLLLGFEPSPLGIVLVIFVDRSVAEVKELVSLLAKHEIGLELNLADFYLCATILLWSCQAIDIVDRVSGLKSLLKSVIPVLAIVSEFAEAFVDGAMGPESKLVRDFHIFLLHCATICIDIGNMADGKSIGAPA